MSAESLTDRLHARSDAKLKDYCRRRFGDLFEMCGGHNSHRKPELSKELSECLATLGAKTDRTPWHGAVWALAQEMLFLCLRDKWRTDEVADFIDQVESMKDTIRELEVEVAP